MGTFYTALNGFSARGCHSPRLIMAWNGAFAGFGRFIGAKFSPEYFSDAG
jgi:hypothetical protein